MNFLNMSFHNGTTRFVVTIPCLNIALKFAHIHPIRFIKTLCWLMKTYIKNPKNNRNICKELLISSDEISLTPRWQFRGIYCNLREYRFYKKTNNPFLWPTLFSLFGLINIQPIAKNQPKETEDQKLSRFVDLITDGQAPRDGHTLREEQNYVVDVNSYLRLLDYGSKCSQEIISKYGDELYTKSRGLF